MEIGAITNPNSRKNRNRPDRASRLQRIVGDMGEVHQTTSVESIKPVLRDFLRKRARYWVADGGDGALHWMLRMGMEVLQEDEFADQSVTLPTMLPTKGGTIDFVANNVGIEGDAEGILATLRGSSSSTASSFRSARTASRRRRAASASASTRSTTRNKIRTRARSSRSWRTPSPPRRSR